LKKSGVDVRILKYPLEVTDIQTIELPFVHEVLTAQMQDGKLYIWVRVDDNILVSTEKKIAIYGTGHPLPEDCGRYLSTIQYLKGQVYHIFELS
jgi:hypothetical protein